MKKIIVTIMIIASIGLVACGNDPWYQPDPNMPQEYIESNKTVLNDNLEILKDDPENIGAQFELGFRYDLLGDYRNAEAAYKKVLELSPKHFAARTNIVNLYEAVEEYELAAEYVMKLYSTNQTNIEILKDTVRILLKADMPDSAKEALENFSRKTKDSEIEGLDILIGEQFELILNYKNNHEN